MPETIPTPSQHTFIVRFWWEGEGMGTDWTKGWRGRVEHVQSGEGLSFTEMSQLFTFIQGFLHPLSSPPMDQAFG